MTDPASENRFIHVRRWLLLLALLAHPWSGRAIDPVNPVPQEDDVPPFDTSPVLAFSVDEGDVQNLFYRRGPVAAHLIVRSGEDPRVIVAFPAGNEGMALWFEAPDGRVDLDVMGDVKGVWNDDGSWGIAASVRSTGGPLTVRRAVLGSIRVIRDVEHTGEVPPDVGHSEQSFEQTILTRTLHDGRKLALSLTPVPDGGLDLVALTEARPLTPIPMDELLQEGVGADPADLQALAFLSYREKLLAGSWRFLTYFGRDTLLSTMMLMPVLRPEVTEAALGSVLERMGPHGEVAHEEDIGDWAALRTAREWTQRPDGAPPPVLAGHDPIYDYKMVDDDFMLAPVLAHYLLGTDAGLQRGADFLARTTAVGSRYSDLLRLNLELVMQRAGPFAAEPVAANLIALRDGEQTGEWRDSEEGLGKGHIPYNVNGVLVPAALEAAAQLLSSPQLGSDPKAAERARELAAAWDGVADLFTVEIESEKARQRVGAYARELGLDPVHAASVVERDVTFPAVALDDQGTPLPIMHSDDGFALLFGRPDLDHLAEIADRILRPFPAGLRTPVGVVVANPAYTDDPDLRALFTRGHYHGTVVWSWQQAMLADGLAWQLLRDDLPEPTRRHLAEAQRVLWEVIGATADTRRAELWSWSVEEGRITAVPFGQEAGHKTESNAVQLWSTVYLAVQPPGQ